MDAVNKRDLVGSTLSPCGRCGTVLETLLEDSENDIYMVRTCPEHGRQRRLYFRDSTLYRAAIRFTSDKKRCARPVCIDGTPCRNHLSRSTTVLLNVTDRCNLSCPTCLAESGNVNGTEPSLEQIAHAFPLKGLKRKPTVCLIGGEPTLRKDLPDIIRLLKKNGYVPRLNTNGLRLESEGYRNKLREAGLDWIILQFDGLSEESSMVLRGERLAERKLALVKTIVAEGFRVQLAVMTVDEVNGHEVDDILRFALDSGIFWVSFYPHTIVGRASLESGTTHVADVMNRLEQESNGMLTRKDFLDSMRLWSFLYRIFPQEPFRQKLSTFPMLLTRRGEDYLPLTRLLGVGRNNSLRPLAVLSLLPAFVRAFRYKESKPDSRLLFLSLEKFHDHETLDLLEASSCHMCYMTSRGTVAFDIFNRFHRNNRNW